MDDFLYKCICIKDYDPQTIADLDIEFKKDLIYSYRTLEYLNYILYHVISPNGFVVSLHDYGDHMTSGNSFAKYFAKIEDYRNSKIENLINE